MLLRNIDVSDGSVNGSQGVIVGMTHAGDDVSVILIVFTDHSEGQKARYSSRHLAEKRKIPNAVPIQRTEIAFTVNKKNKGLTITRSQFPLKLALAFAIQKVQGMTVSQIVVSFQSRFNDGQTYVALSRVKSVQCLFLLDFDPQKIRANKSVKDEMAFLAEEKSLLSSYSFFHAETLPVVSMLNVRSLPLNQLDVLRDSIFLLSQVLVLTETCLARLPQVL